MKKDYSSWYCGNRDGLIAHFRENYLVHHLEYEAWTLEDVRRFKEFCDEEFKRVRVD